jgi:hypothetical protein
MRHADLSRSSPFIIRAVAVSTTRPCIERICHYCGRHFVALLPEPDGTRRGNFYCCHGHMIEDLRRPQSSTSTTRRFDA